MDPAGVGVTVKKVTLRCYSLNNEDGEWYIRGSTERGASYKIVLSALDADRAQCGITKLGTVVADQVKSERRHHRWLHGRVAGVWRGVKDAMEEDDG